MGIAGNEIKILDKKKFSLNCLKLNNEEQNQHWSCLNCFTGSGITLIANSGQFLNPFHRKLASELVLLCSSGPPRKFQMMWKKFLVLSLYIVM